MTWRDASIEALKGAGPLTARQIVERIEELGLRPVTGRTPDATVGAQMYTSINDGDPRIRQVSPGVFEHTGSTEQPRTNRTLGRLELLDVRDVWPDEARNFTPWLLENADYLSEILGIDLELEERERPVGSFSLDLFGRDLTNETPLIVENQIEPTDHRHLGQLLTYAAGTDATTVVWVASKFRDEHRQALEFLNNMSGDTARFFGIEIKVAVIGDSDAAPVFNLVAQPSDWRSQVATQRANSGLSELKQSYQAFWTEFLVSMEAAHPGVTRVRRATTSKRIALHYFRKRTLILAGFGKGGQIFVELYIDPSSATQNQAIFDALATRRSDIDAAIGADLQWLRMDNSRACKVRLEHPGRIDDVDAWPAHIVWFTKWFLEFRRVFGREVPALDESLWENSAFDETDEDELED